MKLKILAVLIPAVCLGLAFSAQAASTDSGVNVSKLMSSEGCSACHAEKTKRVGPAWGWVAWRYKDKKGASSVNDVANFIINGGTGYWKKWTGGIPMPAHGNLSQKQARAIAKWILKQPPIQPPKK
jgi:cytochrome c